MSERYSLRQTPKKTEHAAFIETPKSRGPNRRISRYRNDDDDGGGTSSANESSRGTSTRSCDEQASITEKAMNHTSHKSAMNGNAPNGSAIPKQASTEGCVIQKRLIDGWREGLDSKVDYGGHVDFFGSWGVSVMMIGFPLLMYYMWIGATYYDGKFPTPVKGQTLWQFVIEMGKLTYIGAYPSLYAWTIYWGFFVFEVACYCLLPGIWTKGKPLQHEQGKQLDYYCSGVWSFYTSIVVFLALHTTGIFPLYTLIDEFGPLMSVAIISGFLVAFIAYFSALARGAQHRMTGYAIYDFFMGAELNPRLFGILDFKMFFEVRLPWYMLFAISSAAAARQYEELGYVSWELAFLVMAHFLYANACSKGEECIVPTWDIYYEKWGFMLIFWNMAGVPLSYCHCTIYLANQVPPRYHWNGYFITAFFTSYLFVYWVWDTTNSQKNRFRASERGNMIERRTFPQLPWQTVKNPRVIRTASGDSLLADGWYGYARKIHYTCDLYFALTWGLVTGFDSPFPWFYPVFFAAMISHRAYRDLQRCRIKYGQAWEEYTNLVPWLFVPYVF